MTILDRKSKVEIRFFTYYFANGTLDFDLLNNQLKTYHIDFISENPSLFFEVFCVFANHKKRAQNLEPMNKRVAQYICKTIDIENFRHFDNFENWELNFEFDGDNFTNCLKDFAYRIAFDKIQKLSLKKIFFKECITYGATFWETVFVIWANNLQFSGDKVINQEYAIERATQWFLDNEKVEEWEIELEM